MHLFKHILRPFTFLVLGLTLAAGTPASGLTPVQASSFMATTIGPIARNDVSQATVEQTAIQQAITRANVEQVQALASGDATVMADTATTAYYQTLVQTNKGLAAAGVTAIKLDNIAWGPITVQGTKATAVTDETWTTSYKTGRTVQSTDRNIYTLVQTNGAWKISADDHSSIPQTTTPGNPAPSTAPSTATKDTSRNWSGYAASGSNFTAVSGTWTIPQPSGSTGRAATWVGIGGVTSRDLIQAGTEEQVQASGRVVYDAWIEMLPAASQTVDLPVHPGDSVTVSIAEQQVGNWLIRIDNNTTGQNYQKTVSYASTNSSVEWVEEAPSSGRSILPLENFGAVTFTGGTARQNEKTVSIREAGGQPIRMIDASSRDLAVPSALTSDGSGFSVTRTSTPSTGSSSAPGTTPLRRRPFGSFGF